MGESPAENPLPEVMLERLTRNPGRRACIMVVVENKVIGDLYLQDGHWVIDIACIRGRAYGDEALSEYGMPIFEEARKQAEIQFPNGIPANS